MDILDRIQLLLGSGDQKALTDYLGLKKTAFTDWKSGKSNSYRKYLIEIAKFFNVSIDYLVYGKECTNQLSDNQRTLLSCFQILNHDDQIKVVERAETLAELAAERAAEQKKENKTEQNGVLGKCLPLNGTCDKTYYGNAACAGTGLYLDEAIAETITVRSTPEALAADFAIPISGDSMEDEYHDGDIVLVESCPCVRKGEVGIFLIDGDVCIKEYGGRFLTSYNPKYDPVDLSKHESVFCLGRVIGIAEVVSKTHF